MTKQPKIVPCATCGREIAASAKKCPHCGAKVKRPFYKKVWFWLLILIFVLFVLPSACSGGSSSVQTDANKEPLSSEEVKLMYAAPNDYRGSSVVLTGKIFNEPSFSSNGASFQIFGDPNNSQNNTMIEYTGETVDLKSGDYVRVYGTVSGEAKGMNLFGGVVTAPRIKSNKIEKISYIDAASPTLCTMKAEEETIEQHGYSVTVEKVELAENETRVYLSVTNNGKDSFIVSTYSAKIIQNGKQYEKEYNFNADYPEVQTDIAPGVTSEGIIAFKAIEKAPFQIILPGMSSNWQEEINDYKFDVSIQE